MRSRSNSEFRKELLKSNTLTLNRQLLPYCLSEPNISSLQASCPVRALAMRGAGLFGGMQELAVFRFRRHRLLVKNEGPVVLLAGIKEVNKNYLRRHHAKPSVDARDLTCRRRDRVGKVTNDRGSKIDGVKDCSASAAARR